MADNARVDELVDKDVYDNSGSKIGKAADVYLDDETELAEWLTVHTGLFGTKESFVPLRDAEIGTDGIRVAVGKDTVKDAPKVDPSGHLSPTEERELYSYYGLPYTPPRAETVAAPASAEPPGGEPPVAGRDVRLRRYVPTPP